MKSSISALVSLAAVLALSGCEEGRKALPNVSVHAVHAAPSYLTIDFLREERVEASLNYGSASAHRFDADQYDFNVEVTPPAGRERIGTFSATFEPDNDYYLVLAEEGGSLAPGVIGEPAFAADSAEAEFSVYSAAEALGPIDIYIEAPDADPAAATPFGSIAFRERIEPATRSPGDFRITLTAPGAPGEVLYRSPPISAPAGSDNLLVITDGAGQTRAAANVVRAGTVQETLADVDAAPALRVINGASDRESKDVVVDGTTLFDDLPFATAVDYAELDAGGHDLTVTPADNPGVLEIEESFSAGVGVYYTYYIAGTDSSGLSGQLASDDRRAIADTARVRLVSLAARFDSLQFLLVEPGANLDDAEPQVELAAPGTTQLAPFPPGDYDLALRNPASGSIVAGPTTVSLAERGIYTIVAIDGADPATADVLLLDDFP